MFPGLAQCIRTANISSVDKFLSNRERASFGHPNMIAPAMKHIRYEPKRWVFVS